MALQSASPACTIATYKVVDVAILAIIIFLSRSPLPKSKIRSYDPGVPVNFTTATAVKPPFVAIFNVCEPPSIYCNNALSKGTAPPLPAGPAEISNTAVLLPAA